ncbi:MAG: hypothetical protein JRF20_09335 [Deltaproteobacteria bacterium]|nr:hypothetical protein [Deltaproteobacteria bacterium]MBW2351373.1 hypothetical protein [Deltaproteobacteria bacterium]
MIAASSRYYTWEGADNHHKTENPIRKSQYCPEEDIQTLFRTVAKPGKQLSVILEIAPEQNRDAENELPVRDGVFDCSTFTFCFKIDFEQEANLITWLIPMDSAIRMTAKSSLNQFSHTFFN